MYNSFGECLRDFVGVAYIFDGETPFCGAWWYISFAITLYLAFPFLYKLKKRLELEKVREFLDEHFTDKITLDELSAQFFINKYYLTRIFKETYGSTISHYVLTKRITRAKQLIRFSGMTMDEIAETVGMNDANYFSRAFRKVEGISPTEYQKQW